LKYYKHASVKKRTNIVCSVLNLNEQPPSLL